MKVPLVVLLATAALVGAGHAAAAAPPEFLYVSNYGAGTVTGFRVDAGTGALTEVPGSPFAAGSSLEDLAIDPTNRFLYVGGVFSTTFAAFSIGADGSLTPLPGSPFAAAANGVAADMWSLAVHPSGRFLYAADPAYEKIRGFTLDPATGVPTPMPGTGFTLGNNADALAIHPSGRFLYGGAQGGGDGISAYTVEPASGALSRLAGTPVPGGISPLGAVVEPSGRYLFVANGGSDDVSRLALDPATGFPTAIGATAAGDRPAAIAVTPSARFVYVANAEGDDVSGYAIDHATGALAPVGAPVASGGYPNGLVVHPTNRFLYAADRSLSSVSSCAIGPDGTLTPLATDLLPLPSYPSGIVMTSHDRIFADGFESAGLGAWSLAATDDGDLAVTAAAALHGAQGLQATVDDVAPLFVVDDTPAAEDRYRARFLLRPVAFDTGVAQGHHRARVLIGFREGPLRRVLTLVLRYRAGQYALGARVLLDDGTRADTAFVSITDIAPHAIQVDWRRATGPDVSDGSLELFVDDVSAATLTGLDNHDARLDFVRLGAMSLKSGATGTIRFDAFESRRYNFIWPTF